MSTLGGMFLDSNPAGLTLFAFETHEDLLLADIDADADAYVDFYAMIGQLERAFDQVFDAPRGETGNLGLRAGQQHGELIAAETCNRIRRTHRGREPLRHLHEQPIAGGVAERVVHFRGLVLRRGIPLGGPSLGDWYSEGAFLWEVHPWGTGTPKGHSSGSLIPGELVLLRGIPSGGPSLGGWYSEGAFLWEVHPAGAVPQ